MDDKAKRTLKLNAAMHLVDDAAKKAGDPADQMGVLFMAHVLAVRRLLAQHNITDRGRRLKIIKTAVAEFDAKLRKYVRPEASDGDVLSMAEHPSEPLHSPTLES